ncbi:peptide-methionine (S)-S-oxide reductase MsrA [Sphingomicrobium nitratireducens]|uniref:peptide-methionine (S)-S-oxide reductase MsrA n=1 Tax=Sphingomicrobium nitratireducens TaxID=2964666 RepID=UPI00223F6F53|nr:peptide-methionine (S)-S-oxide reductase MsrA [Sphingomicrobium nitratireducens]
MTRILAPLLGLAAVLGLVSLQGAPAIASSYERVPAARFDPDVSASNAVAVIAGGCFWGVEAVFERVDGVKSAVSGYAGGKEARPTYGSVSSGRSGHAEVVRVTYDPRVVSYGDLLRVYFSVIADPTLKNRQGPDVGPQYRTALFPLDATQRKVARAYIAQLDKAGTYSRPIVTTLESGRFYPAEPYHQDFMKKNPRHPYIVAHDLPKVRAFAKLFPDLAR